MKLKIYKLERDSRKTLINQIEWLSNDLNVEWSNDYIKYVCALKKRELIDLWVTYVVKLGYPKHDWLQIYY